ncbi:MAG TPA: sugar transferase [Puia sp.]|jgi:putative colanic acid biosynthesis UDP-glucose lipid carrier transferase|nr:sugar transferase [Puia sp.]
MRSTIIESTIYYQKNWEEGQQVEIRHHLYAKRSYFTVKRGMDLTIALLVSLLIFPWLFPVIILLIKLDSKGPAFFSQNRVGFLGETFACYKFRTMYVNDAADTRQAVKNDPRVTRIGKFLRNTGLDELPQFINVLLGHMSIVGPRPHMLKDSQEFAEVVADYKFRNLVRPGITGMSQVRGYRGPATTFQSIFRRYQWDAYYVRNINFFLDMKIMSETGILMLKSVFQKEKPLALDNSLYEHGAIGSAKKIA